MFFIILLVGWYAIASCFSDLILPSPKTIAIVLFEGLLNGYFLPHIGRTLTEIFFGLLIGSVIGVMIGLIMGEIPFLRKLLHPYVIASQAVPKLALAPLFVLWFGFGISSKVVITALICFFPLLENTLAAMQQIDKNKMQLFRSLRATRWQTFLYLKVPSSIPQIMAGFKVALILSIVGAVVGEFIGANKGLGALIIAAQGMMDTPLMFAVLILLTFIGILLYQLVQWIEIFILKKYMGD